GMETAYFRFSQSEDKKKLYSTLSLSLFITTILFTGILFLFRAPIADAAGLEKHPQYVTWMCGIIFFYTLATLPFANLRQEGRPRKYAFVRVAGIVVNILVVILALGLLSDSLSKTPQ